jgi:hypothetical protein
MSKFILSRSFIDIEIGRNLSHPYIHSKLELNKVVPCVISAFTPKQRSFLRSVYYHICCIFELVVDNLSKVALEYY